VNFTYTFTLPAADKRQKICLAYPWKAWETWGIL